MDTLAIVAVFLTPVVFLAIVIRSLSQRGAWLFTWLRGCTLCLSLALCYGFLATAYEVAKLDRYYLGESVAEVSIKPAADEFLVTVKSDEDTTSSLLDGDAVKLTYRRMKFEGLIGKISTQPMVKLESIDSRYFDFESGNLEKKVEVDSAGLDVPILDKKMTSWSLLRPIMPLLNGIGVAVDMVVVEYIPIKSRAIYELQWQGYGFELIARNLEAQQALQPNAPLASN